MQIKVAQTTLSAASTNSENLFAVYLGNSLKQGCPNSVLEGRCPAEFSSNLPQHTCMEAPSILVVGPKWPKSFDIYPI